MRLQMVIILFLHLLTGCKNTGGEKKQHDTVIPGKETYLKYCLTCHQTDGSGVPGLYPPLNESPFIAGEKEKLIRLILEGSSEDLKISDEVYNSQMPPQNFLTDEQIAGVLTYIRSGFGNDASAVSAGEVRDIRERQNK